MEVQDATITTQHLFKHFSTCGSSTQHEWTGKQYKKKSFKRPELRVNSTGTKKVQVRRRCYWFSHRVKVLSSLITTLKCYKKLYFNSKWYFTLNRVVQVKLCMSHCCRRVVLHFCFKVNLVEIIARPGARWCICVHMCLWGRLHAQIIHIPPMKTICMHLVHTVNIRLCEYHHEYKQEN